MIILNKFLIRDLREISINILIQAESVDLRMGQWLWDIFQFDVNNWSRTEFLRFRYS